ncbi:hypothetical protein SASK131_24600 [Staphylococcus argenteus]|uniref:hypothetical protein n=1 Tax=Staphylococcus argenteus TaxID=985002 RepID=UPI000AB16686|nr:hypothetical protein [Staphylococcus argenteus]MCG9850624.1 hypothetical protein [Staphylococcus argenteus]BCN88782.1 hypothetical protein TMSFP064_17000 [Staphylococcus argenteus]GJF47946.1 hypothetical protein SA19080_24620 [Staphylococcus argenteus]HDY9454927.1 hypothetical protein [Staphylococcus argenteus]HDY9480305.1 hypothetical protein [Staphylococcus argenteus]
MSRNIPKAHQIRDDFIFEIRIFEHDIRETSPFLMILKINCYKNPSNSYVHRRFEAYYGKMKK